MDIEDFFVEWDEDELAELLEDDNSSLLKPAWALIGGQQFKNSS